MENNKMHFSNMCMIYQQTNLSVVFLILLQNLNHQLSQANSVLQFFGRGD